MHKSPLLEGADGCFWPAVAQEKPALRKRILTELGDRAGQFAVRYVSGGVRMERIRNA